MSDMTEIVFLQIFESFSFSERYFFILHCHDVHAIDLIRQKNLKMCFVQWNSWSEVFLLPTNRIYACRINTVKHEHFASKALC